MVVGTSPWLSTDAIARAAGNPFLPDLSAVGSRLLKAAVAALGGQGGGGRPDMAQGGGPDGSKAKEALDAVKDALEKVAA